MSKTVTPILSEPMDLISATSVGAYNVVEDILRSNLEDVNRVNASGWTPVMYAANYGHFNIIRLLIRFNCDVNHKDWQGRTPLMLAASNGHTRCLDVLINYGKADKTLRDVSGNDAYRYAKNCGHGNNKLIKSLLLKSDGYELKGRPFMAPTPAPSPVNQLKTSKDSEEKKVNDEIYNPFETTAFSHSLSKIWEPKELRNDFDGSLASIACASSQSSQSSSPNGSSILSSSQSSYSSIGSVPKLRRKTISRKKCSGDGLTSPMPKTLFHLLTRIDLIQYLDAFESNGIDFQQFLTLTDTDFQKLGIDNYGHRKKLFIAQMRYHESLDINTTQEAFLADYLLNERDVLNKKIKELEERMREMLSSKN